MATVTDDPRKIIVDPRIQTVAPPAGTPGVNPAQPVAVAPAQPVPVYQVPRTPPVGATTPVVPPAAGAAPPVGNPSQFLAQPGASRGVVAPAAVVPAAAAAPVIGAQPPAGNPAQFLQQQGGGRGFVPAAAQPAPVAPVPLAPNPALDAVRQPGAVGTAVGNALGAVGRVLGAAPVESTTAAIGTPAMPVPAAPVVQPPATVAQPAGGSAPGPYTVPGAGSAPVSTPAPVAAATPDTNPAAAASAQTAATLPAVGATPGAPATTGEVRREGNTYSGTNVAGPITVNGRAPSGFVTDGSYGGGGNVTPAASGVGGFKAGATPLADAAIAAQAAQNSRPGGAVHVGPDLEAKAAQGQRERTQYLLEQAIAHGFTTRKGNSNDGLINSLAGQLGVQDTVAGRNIENRRNNTTANDVAAMRESGETARLGTREAGDTMRLGMREAGDTARAATTNEIARGRLGVEQADLGLRTTAAGFQADTQRRLAAAQNELAGAKTPEAIRAAQTKVLALQGRDAPNRYTVVPGGQVIENGLPVTRPSSVIDNQTGQLVNPGGGAAPAGSPPPVAEGSMSKTASGQAIKFVGGKWVAA